MHPYIGDVGEVYRKFGQDCSKYHVVSWFLDDRETWDRSLLRVDLLNKMSKITQCNE